MPNKWLDFLKNWKATKGKGLSLKECMKKASVEYKKSKKNVAKKK